MKASADNLEIVLITGQTIVIPIYKDLNPEMRQVAQTAKSLKSTDTICGTCATGNFVAVSGDKILYTTISGPRWDAYIAEQSEELRQYNIAQADLNLQLRRD